MTSFGVRCDMADGEPAIITVDATDAHDARRQVERHRWLFYGSGDVVGRRLAAKDPYTIVSVGEVKPLEEWS